jgi:hypothetical protein
MVLHTAKSTIEKPLLRIILSAIVFCTPTLAPLFALDTVETAAVGPLTDFEAYCTNGFAKGGNSHGLDVLIGGGFTESLSYNVSSGFYRQDSQNEIPSIGLGLIWTPYKNDRIALDLMPSLSADSSKTSGKTIYPGFKVYTAGLDAEINITISKFIQPYIHAGFHYSKDFSEKVSIWEAPFALGIDFLVNEGTEILIEGDWTHAKGATWKESERYIAVGFNKKLIENLELITEAGREFSNKEYIVMLGLIYAL